MINKSTVDFRREILELASELALENARELYEEAQILKNHKKYARAWALCQLSSEEIGKVFVILNCLVTNDYSDEKQKSFLQEYTSHKIKINKSNNIMILIQWLFNKGNIDKEVFTQLKYENDKIDFLNDMKNNSLYSFIDGSSAIKPSQIIDKEFVKKIYEEVKLKISGTEQALPLLLKNLDNLILLVQKE